jgi:hypothetical protein
MAELTFAQPERRNYLVPGLIVLVLAAIAAALIYRFTPHRIAGIAITHVAVVPIRTVMKTGSELVGAQESSQDDLYVLATVRVDDRLHLPLFLKDITGTLTTPQGESDSSAVEKNDLDNLYTTFPQLKTLAGPPLYRDTAIQPNSQVEGMVILHFPVDQATWDKRTATTLTLNFYYQGPITVPIPNS